MPALLPAACVLAGATMVTIQELLTRIQWDREFGAAEFELGCFDRVSGRVERVPLARVHLEPGRHFAFSADDGQGMLQTIPFHRVRAVYRNGERIWARPVAPRGGQ